MPLFIQTPPGVHCYVLFTFGYHVQDFFTHLFAEKYNNWNELFLHHVLVLALYPGFFFGNLMGVGTVLAWLHDIADFPVNLCRIFQACDMKIPTVVFYLVLVATWFYTRLCILPYYIFEIVTALKFPEPIKHFQHLVHLVICFLMVMQLLHIYWFGIFLQIGFRLVTKGETNDIIDNIQDTSAVSPRKKTD